MSDQPVTDEPVDEFTQSFMEAIESRFPAQSSAEPSPETDPVAPGDEQPVEGPETSSPEIPPQEVPAEEEQPQPEAEPVTAEGVAEGGEAPGGEPVQSAPAFTLSGVEYTPDQVAQALQVNDWFARLNPNQVQAIDALLSGGYRLAPVNEAAPVVAPPQPTTPSSPTPPAGDEGEWLDPRAAQEIGSLRQQITELRDTFTRSLTPVVQQQQDADYQARLSEINAAHASFQERYQLGDDAMTALEKSIAEGQFLPGLAQRHGSIQAGMNAALEMTFWTTPSYRDPYLQSRVAASQAEQATEEAATIRKQHLTALSGSGGSAPRREPVPSTPEDRHAAMVNEIASAMNGTEQVQ